MGEKEAIIGLFKKNGTMTQGALAEICMMIKIILPIFTQRY